MNVNWTFSAFQSYEEEIEFIRKKWNDQEVEKFEFLVDDFIQTLSQNILLGKVTSRTNVYSHVISKQTTVLYRGLDEQTIELLLFWNNLKDPSPLERFINQ